MQTQIEMQTQIKMQKKREMRKQSDMRRNILIETSIEGVESILNEEENLKNDHEFVAHCHKIIALIKREKTLNLLRGLHLDITNKLLGENLRHAKCGIYNYPAYQSYQNLQGLDRYDVDSVVIDLFNKYSSDADWLMRNRVDFINTIKEILNANTIRNANTKRKEKRNAKTKRYAKRHLH